MHPPNIFRGKDDNAFITPNIERNCYAIAIKHSISGDNWQGCKSMHSPFFDIGEGADDNNF